MADVTGPISTMPGSTHEVPEGMMCDDHPDRPAVKRVQGETDSYGSEMIDMCQECYDQHLEEKKNPIIGTCDCCKATQVEVFPRRSFEEGPAGRIYDYCKGCMAKEAEYLQREFGSPDDDIPDIDEVWLDDDWPPDEDEEDDILDEGPFDDE